VINRAAKLATQGDGRQALLKLLANAAQRSPRDRYTVVFDGQRGGSRTIGGGGVQVLYSSAQETADDAIKRLAARDMTVVSDDREVCDKARNAGARAMSVGDFVRRIQGPRRS